MANTVAGFGQIERIVNLGFDIDLAVLGLSGANLILIAVLVLVLFAAKGAPPFIGGLRRGWRQFNRDGEEIETDLGRHAGASLGKAVADALTHSNQTAEFQNPPALRPQEVIKNMKNGLILWVAQGFGVGRAPFAPGTFGSLLGLGWFALLLLPGNPWMFAAGIVVSIFLSVRICGEAERILVVRDPSSVVLDEIIAIPICFVAWMWIEFRKHGVMPAPDVFFVENWLLTLGVFFAFRFFDVIKPWPIRQSQSMRGGWGVTVDDVLAAVAVNLLVLLVWISAS